MYPSFKYPQWVNLSLPGFVAAANEVVKEVKPTFEIVNGKIYITMNVFVCKLQNSVPFDKLIPGVYDLHPNLETAYQVINSDILAKCSLEKVHGSFYRFFRSIRIS